MPIYEFDCQDCGTRFEHLQSFSATALPSCPTCGSHHVGRLLGRPAIHFKGSGWYVTDSRNARKGAATSSASAKEGAEGTEAKAGGSGEPGAAGAAGTTAKTSGAAPKEAAQAPAPEA